jgi:hypothetical protein
VVRPVLHHAIKLLAGDTSHDVLENFP